MALSAVEDGTLDLAEALDEVEAAVLTPEVVWREALPRHRRQLQGLLFREGVAFDGERISTPQTPNVFKDLRQLADGRSEVVPPRGVEPLSAE